MAYPFGEEKQDFFYINFVIMNILNLFDIVSTIICLNAGATEINPFYNADFLNNKFYLIPFLFIILYYLTGNKYLNIIFGIYSMVLLNNIFVYVKI